MHQTRVSGATSSAVGPMAGNLGTPDSAAGGRARDTEAAVISVRSVSKRFGSTQALAEVTMSVSSGEVRGLVGRNGAGKSTLVSLMTGVDRPDVGEISVAGRAPTPGGPDLACVYQHSRLVPALSVAENLVLGHQPKRMRGWIDWRRVNDYARSELRVWGLDHLASKLVESLTPVEAKIVELCRALAQGPRILVLDEPTAGLDARDAERLFTVVEDVKAGGTTVVYVSHHLNEIYRLCDVVTVLRDARHVITAPVTELDLPALVAAMVGDDGYTVPGNPEPDGNDGAHETGGRSDERPMRTIRLRVRGLEVPRRVECFDLEVEAGDCVGIAGIEGSGKAEVGAVLAGILRPAAGSVAVDGRNVPLGNVRGAVAAGISYVPPDRHAQGLVPQMSVSDNTTLPVLRRLARRPIPGLPLIVRPVARERAFQQLAEQWEIVASSPRQPIAELSGGNQQKCVMARGLASEPAVLVLHNPTAGIDVAAKASIMRTIADFLGEGACCVVISEDADDFALCSRILVVVGGRLTSRLESGWSESDLVCAMQGRS